MSHKGVIPVWALGETRPMSERERKLTSAVYVQIPGLLEHVRREGRLPGTVPGGGREIGLRIVVQRRGLDLHLTEAEQEVFDALGTEGDAPGGRAVLLGVDDAAPRPSEAERADLTGDHQVDPPHAL